MFAAFLLFDELSDKYPETRARGPYRKPQGRRGLPFSVSRIDLNVSFTHVAVLHWKLSIGSWRLEIFQLSFCDPEKTQTAP
jgi:hypothetical protein